MRHFRPLLIAVATLLLCGTLQLSAALVKELPQRSTRVRTKAATVLPAKRMLNPQARMFAPNSSRSRLLAPSYGADISRATTICGSLLTQDQPGMYSYDLTTNLFSPLLLSDDLFANGGGFLLGNSYYSFVIEVTSYGSVWITVYTFDTTTWEETHSGYMTYRDTPMDLDADPQSNKVYGCFPATSSLDATEFVWAQFNPTSLTRMAIATYSTPLLAVACDAKGQYFGIDTDGDLYKINKHTGEKTLVGSTGLELSDARQSAAFDRKYGQLYLAAELADYSTGLYEIDTTTGKATLINTFPDETPLMGIFVPAPKADFNAPAAVEALTANFEKDALTGVLSFTLPAKTYGGNALSGKVSYTITCDGEQIASGQGDAAQAVEVPVTVTDGFHNFEVTPSNAYGDGPMEHLSLYVGADAPNAVKDLKAEKLDGSVTISWQAPDGSQNGGWFDPAALTYTVVRKTDGKVICERKPVLSVTDEIDADELKSWEYEVTPFAGNVAGLTALSNGVVTGTCVNVPWESDFADDAMFQAYTVINVHGDKYTWTHYPASDWRSGAYCDYDFTNPKDDWLITPPIKLENGKSYKLEFMTSTKRARPEKLEVMYGTAATVEGMTNTIMEPTTFTTDDYNIIDIELVHEYYVTPDADGLYYVGFHAMSEPQMSALILKYVKITEAGVAAAPAAPTDLQITPGENGSLTADVSFTAPATAINGQPLQAIDKIEIMVNGALADEVTDVTPGQPVTRTVPTAQGDNEIRVKAYNANGAGFEAIGEVYTGVVKPDVATNIKASLLDGQVKLSWSAPTIGEDGGYINPAELTYMIMRNDRSILEYDYEGTEFIDDLSSFDIGDQRIVSYIVYPKSAAGTGYGAYSNGIVLGEGFYTLPFTESFPGSKATMSPWGIESTTETSWFVTRDGTYVKAYDGDNGQAFFVPKGPGESSMIYTGRFNFNNTVNPAISLMYYNDGESSNELEVLWTTNYSDFKPLGKIRFDDASKEVGWTECKISLAELKDLPMVAFGIKGTSDESNWQHNQYIDLIRVFDDLEYNLEMTEFDSPSNISFGNEGTFGGYITNRGTKKASGYSIDILCAGEVVANIPGEALAPGDRFKFTCQFKPRFEHAPAALFKAVINWDKDQNAADNSSDERNVLVTVNAFPTVTDLAGTRDESDNAVLSWSAPAPGTTMAVTTESFESHIPFIIEDIEPWKLVDVDGEDGTFGITYGGANVEFMNATYPHAWMVFNPASCGMDMATIGIDALMPHSGAQYLASFQDADGLCDDWLISPELSGDAQTVTFWVRTPIANYGFETFEVLYSTTGNNPEDFTKINGVKEEAFVSWEEVAVSLPEGARYFAIRHTSANKFVLAVDDISYVAKGAAPEDLVVQEYYIYRDDLRIASVPASENSFIDTTAKGDDHHYAVTVKYTHGESGYSNPVFVKKSGIQGVQNGAVSVIAERGAVRVCGAEGLQVRMTTADGKTVCDTQAADELLIPAQPGIYVVSVGAGRYKVLVK